MQADQKLEAIRQPETARSHLRGLLTPRNALMSVLVVVSALAFAGPLRRLAALSMSSDEYSYLALIPVIVLGLFYIKRNVVFRNLRYSVGLGTLVILAGAALAGAAVLTTARLTPDITLSLKILSLAIIWIGCFALCYGTDAARAGLFPLLFSLLLTPLPQSIMTYPIEAIQRSSADVTALLFTLFGIPAFREGMTFSLPRLNFVVARECSGIHSSTALFIASILLGHFWCRSAWKQGLLVLVVYPIISFTNGLRMFVLAVLAVYVNPAFFHGSLHRKGGILFFALGLLILMMLGKLLRGPQEGSAGGRHQPTRPARGAIPTGESASPYRQEAG